MTGEHADEAARRQALADFLRARRESLGPSDVGLPGGRRRRTPGLRREEVAQLASIGPTWYTALEQARDVRVSAQVLDNLSRALRLNPTERTHLFALANREPQTSASHAEHVTPSLQAFLDRQLPLPAYVMGRRWDVLGWNSAAVDLFGDFGSLPAERRNMLWLLFRDPRLRELLVDWESHAQQVLAQFRASWGRHTDDPAFGELIAHLRETSAEFDAWWPHHGVRDRPEDPRVFHLADGRRLALTQITLRADTNPDLRVVVYVDSTTL